MNRRDILKTAAMLPIVAGAGFISVSAKTAARPKMIKPNRLRPGDTVAVIAPASGATPEAFERALANVATLGLKAKVGKYARGSKDHLSGTDAERLHDLHWAFEDKEVNGVWCVRGGSGAPRLLPEINYSFIKRNPKVLIGYSDITALHMAISQQTGLVTFHGPVATSELSEYTKTHLVNSVMSPPANYKIQPSEYNLAQASALFKPLVITPGKARGRLIGGNLSLLSALAGTPYALKDVKGAILFAEDINEPPYKVDWLFTQLRQSCDMKSLAGVALGVFSSAQAATDAETAVTLRVLRDRLGDLGIPVITGLSIGHIRDQFTLPMGIEAELDTEGATVTMLESPVI
ncbi:MAG: LD-carboxypeptidase [Acidobacteria bacterium]|nr:LD-carboxypeptidase [Acidobacteriota bacterium]